MEEKDEVGVDAIAVHKPQAPKRVFDGRNNAPDDTQAEPQAKKQKTQPLSSLMKPSQIPNPFPVPSLQRLDAGPFVGVFSTPLQDVMNLSRSASTKPRPAARSTPLRSASVAISAASMARRLSNCSIPSLPSAQKLIPKRAPQLKPPGPAANRRAAPAPPPRRADAAQRQQQRHETEAQLAEVAGRYEAQLSAVRDAHAKLKAQGAALREENVHLRAQHDALQGEVDRLREEAGQVERLKKQVATLKEEAQSLAALNEQYALTLEHTKRELSQRMAELIAQQDLSAALRDSVNNLEKTVEQKQAEVQQMDHLLKNGEALRRRMHNTIQELKGNIRVYCRVRPAFGGKPQCLQLVDGDDKAVAVMGGGAKTVSGQEAASSHHFQFDKVFPPAASNAAIFEEVSQLVQSALDGYRVCIFAYGQTGSGKTHTMEGPQDRGGVGSDVLGEHCGLIPRAVLQVFATGQELALQGWAFALTAHFLEIYNEQVRDLLADDPAAALGSPSGCRSPKAQPKPEIKHGGRSTTVTNVQVVAVSDAPALLALLKRASKNRAFAATRCNDRSSRSHAVFTLNIDGTNAITGQQTHGVLHLIDLAGSERLQASGAVADRQRETQHINKSLSCLGNVIAALAAKQRHIPFRDSKLTYLLQNCLGGDAKTLMFVNVSPEAEHVGETLCSLRFAAKVNSCEIGTAKRNVGGLRD